MKSNFMALCKKAVSIATAAAMLCTVIPVSAAMAAETGSTMAAADSAEYEIYPNPQSVEYGDRQMQLTEAFQVTLGAGIDQYTKTRVEETLDVLNLTQTTAAGNTELIVGIYGSGDAADTYGKTHGAETSLFEKEDAYMLFIQDNQIVVLGQDTDAAFYGVTTLKRIFQQVSDRKVTELTVEDYSDIAFRGFIEGYYGNPWSVEDRIELMKFGGEIKMNQYIFAPKDDPYHNEQWRELYPQEELENISKLAEAGNESKCFFVWSLHCFMNSPFRFDTEEHYQADFAVVTAKFSQLLESGVRQFGILADDAQAAEPENTVRLLNDLNTWIAEQQVTYPDLRKDILYCPNDYSGNGSGTQLQTINQVNRNVHIMATGGKIWGEVTADFGRNYFQNIASSDAEGRYPYMWINWPCSDNSKNHLIMGGHNTFLHANIDPSTYEGIVLNPMQQSEPSKTAIFTAADYSWNCWESAEEGDQAWVDSFKYVDHVSAKETDASSALREMSKHMINQAMDSRVTALEESVELAPKLDTFWEAVQSGQDMAAAIETLRPEFELLNQAAILYLKEGGNERLAKQAAPFIQCMRDLAQTNIDLLDALEAMLAGDDDNTWAYYSKALASYEASQTYGYDYVGTTMYAEVGNQYIVPFTEKMMKYISTAVSQMLDPDHVQIEEDLIFQVAGSTGTNNLDADISYATDGNLATGVLISRNQQVGDYVGMTFNQLVEVSNIQIALYRAANPKDLFYDGVMEYTVDGTNWIAFDESYQPEGTELQLVEMSFPTMEIKGFRWKCTDLGERDRWLVIREVAYNVGSVEIAEEKYQAEFDMTAGWNIYSGSIENMTDGDDESYTWFNPSTTTQDTTLVGDYIQLDLGSIREVGRVRALVGIGDGDKWRTYHLEYSADGTDWTALDSYTGTVSGADIYEVNLKGAFARYIRLVNDQEIHFWVKFGEFAAYSYVPGMDETNMDYTNVEDGDWNVEYGDIVSEIKAKEGALLKAGQYIGLKLDRIHALSSVEVSGTQTEALTLEISANGVEWSQVTDGTQLSAARYIRLINNTDAEVSFDLERFVVTCDEIQPADLVETTMGINAIYGGDDARNTGTTRYWMDQDLNSRAIYSDYPQKDGYILYTLGQDVDIHSIKVYVLDTEIDYPRDAVIEVSEDMENWTEVLTIGDGVENDGTEKSESPVNNGWLHDTVDPAFAYLETRDLNVTARYLRMRFTADYAHRFAALNEIRINDGVYMDTINDPTFESDTEKLLGFEPQNLNDRDLTTAYKPNMDGKSEGYLIYHLSEQEKIGRLQIVQSALTISHAMVSVRTEGDQWEVLGGLYKSLTRFDTSAFDHVLDVKIEWCGVTPMIYEVITGKEAGTLDEGQITAAKAALQELLDEDKNLDASEYTLETWNVYQDALTSAEAALAGEEVFANIYAARKAYVAARMNLERYRPESIQIIPNSLELEVGSIGNVAAQVYPEEANQQIIWRSANEAVATVNENGRITANAEGTVTITAVSVEDASVTAQVTVTVIKNQQQVELESEISEAQNMVNADKDLKAADYTAESWSAYQAARTQLEALLEAENTTLAAVKEAKAAYQKAKGALEKATEETEPSTEETEPSTEATEPSTEETEPSPAPVDPSTPEVTQTTYKNVVYKVLSKSGKTAVAAAPKNKKVKSITISPTVKIGATTYKVTQIANKAFQGCKKLTKVTVGKNVKKIGKLAFAQCSKLKTISLKKATGITFIGKSAFRKISTKAVIKVPAKKYTKYKKMLKKAKLSAKVRVKK